jgi:hypothetical protein
MKLVFHTTLEVIKLAKKISYKDRFSAIRCILKCNLF